MVVRQKPYQLLKLMGRGGQGSVFEARDSDGQVVAIKLVPAHERHRNEVRVLASMQSDHIVRLHAAGVTRNTFILVMEKVEGIDLKGLIQFCRDEGRQIPAPIVVDFMMQSCVGLLEALQHGRLAFHRDIKPGNLILGKDGLVKLIDFGIAHLDDMAYTGSLVGTPENMAPEQVGLNEHWKVDLRTDLYCLGMVLYELLTLETVFKFTNSMPVPERLLKVWEADVNEPLTRLEQQYPSIGLFLRKALKRDPAERFQTPVEMLHALAQVREGLAETVTMASFAECIYQVTQHGEDHPLLEKALPALGARRTLTGKSLELPLVPNLAASTPASQAAPLLMTQCPPLSEPTMTDTAWPSARPFWRRPAVVAMGSALMLMVGFALWRLPQDPSVSSEHHSVHVRATERALLGKSTE